MDVDKNPVIFIVLATLAILVGTLVDHLHSALCRDRFTIDRKGDPL